MAHQTITEVVRFYYPYLATIMETLLENEGWQPAGRHRFKLEAILFDVARACFKLGREYEKKRVSDGKVLRSS